MEIDPYRLDWGVIFVDSYNVETKRATLIYNLAFDMPSLYNYYILYVVGHIYWTALNIPAGSSINGIFDLRGRDISQQSSDKIEMDIKTNLQNLVNESLLNIEFKR